MDSEYAPLSFGVVKITLKQLHNSLLIKNEKSYLFFEQSVHLRNVVSLITTFQTPGCLRTSSIFDCGISVSQHKAHFLWRSPINKCWRKDVSRDITPCKHPNTLHLSHGISYQLDTAFLLSALGMFETLKNRK